jgi:hypothetical protein
MVVMFKRKIVNFFYSYIFIFLLCSCVETVPHYSNHKIGLVDKLYIQKMPTNIELIRKGNKALYNLDLSDSVDVLISKQIKKSLPTSIKTDSVLIDDISIKNELLDIGKNIIEKDKIKGIVISEKLSDFYSVRNAKYVLVSQANGFTRTSINLRNRRLKEVALGSVVGLDGNRVLHHNEYTQEAILIIMSMLSM